MPFKVVCITSLSVKIYDLFRSRNLESQFYFTISKFPIEWIRRQENDDRTYGGLFLMLCDEV